MHKTPSLNKGAVFYIKSVFPKGPAPWQNRQPLEKGEVKNKIELYW